MSYQEEKYDKRV